MGRAPKLTNPTAPIVDAAWNGVYPDATKKATMCSVVSWLPNAAKVRAATKHQRGTLRNTGRKPGCPVVPARRLLSAAGLGSGPG